MKLTLQPTAKMESVQGTPCRVWEGETESGTPVKAWVAAVQPQTHDEALLAEFGRELKEMPYQRELVSFDLRMA